MANNFLYQDNEIDKLIGKIKSLEIKLHRENTFKLKLSAKYSLFGVFCFCFFFFGGGGEGGCFLFGFFFWGGGVYAPEWNSGASIFCPFRVSMYPYTCVSACPWQKQEAQRATYRSSQYNVQPF